MEPQVELGMILHMGTVYLMEHCGPKLNKRISKTEVVVNRVYIYDPDEPIQIGYWHSETGITFFPGVPEALQEGDRERLKTILLNEKISPKP